MAKSLSPSLQALLQAALDASKSVGLGAGDYAIGGAVAMHALGYSRHTADVDLFVRLEGPKTEQRAVRGDLIRAFRAMGLKAKPIFSTLHYIAWDPGREDEDERIDILFPSAEPDLSAIAYAEPQHIGEITAPVPPGELLALMKFEASEYDLEGRHLADLNAMHTRGLFDRHLARQYLTSYGSGDDVTRWDEIFGPPTPERL